MFTSCGLAPQTWAPPSPPNKWEADEEGQGPILGAPQGAPSQDWAGSDGWDAVIGGWNVTGALNATEIWEDGSEGSR